MTDNIQEKIEDKIIDWIALDSDGRLVAFKPSGKKTFLAVQKKGGYGGKEIVFKIESFILPQEKKEFKKDIVISEDVKPSKDLFFLFIIFEEVSQNVDENVWIISSSDFFNLAEKIKSKDGKDMLRFDSEKFINYKKNRKDFNLFLIQKLVTENKTRITAHFKRKVY